MYFVLSCTELLTRYSVCPILWSVWQEIQLPKHLPTSDSNLCQPLGSLVRVPRKAMGLASWGSCPWARRAFCRSRRCSEVARPGERWVNSLAAPSLIIFLTNFIFVFLLLHPPWPAQVMPQRMMCGLFQGRKFSGSGFRHLFFELFSLAVLRRERDENNNGRNKLLRRLQYIAFLLPSVLCLLSWSVV